MRCSSHSIIIFSPLPNGLRGRQFPSHNSYLFVDFFFVLSGFVIFHAYRNRIDDDIGALTFAIRRFGRVWPAHMTCSPDLRLHSCNRCRASTTNGFLGITSDQGDYSVRGFALAKVALPNAVGLQGMTTWNGPAWSIGAEFCCRISYSRALSLLAALTGDRIDCAVASCACRSSCGARLPT